MPNALPGKAIGECRQESGQEGEPPERDPERRRAPRFSRINALM
ncbi:hypothetical protein SAMN06265795_102252 [Noviherbaspirillum humi]|uniref:Uncharacterized protein n=1 Tax=Noviherbaspirillum humi TaxID=1688639 RepID=A0A239DKS4_9BURK|nr:hypothetical protein [Noviherbaspirillum humi]SNS33225.1 hypothetical protein SAMN06265795_102252 [Noviherbaspirillum humi]